MDVRRLEELLAIAEEHDLDSGHDQAVSDARLLILLLRLGEMVPLLELRVRLLEKELGR